jgi:hypothetical protein
VNAVPTNKNSWTFKGALVGRLGLTLIAMAVGGVIGAAFQSSIWQDFWTLFRRIFGRSFF